MSSGYLKKTTGLPGGMNGNPSHAIKMVQAIVAAAGLC
jgi:hypothetical protein